jgi:hypothetical protein
LFGWAGRLFVQRGLERWSRESLRDTRRTALQDAAPYALFQCFFVEIHQ